MRLNRGGAVSHLHAQTVRAMIANIVITGLITSGVYALLAIGFSLIFGVARKAAVPVLCIPAQAETGLDHGGLFAAVCPLVDGEVTVADAMHRPAELLRQRAADTVRRFVRNGA